MRRAGVEVSAPLADRYGPIVMAAGAGNQRLYIVNGLDLVVVRQASGVLRALRGGGEDWSDAAFLRALLSRA